MVVVVAVVVVVVVIGAPGVSGVGDLVELVLAGVLGVVVKVVAGVVRDIEGLVAGLVAVVIFGLGADREGSLDAVRGERRSGLAVDAVEPGEQRGQPAAAAGLGSELVAGDGEDGRDRLKVFIVEVAENPGLGLGLDLVE